MTGDDRAALEALQRRLSHTEAIARLIARCDDGDLGEAIHGVVLMLSDAGESLDLVLGVTVPA